MSNLNQIRQKYLDFYAQRSHIVIPSASLLPTNDPTTLFTSSGMQPLIKYFFGTPHPAGKRLTDSQKCFRSVDIDEVGDNRHTTFFEMLGNWSFGDYFKQKQIGWIFEFMTQVIGLDPQRLYVTVFAGEEQLAISRDNESIGRWQDLFASHNITNGVEDNPAQNGLSPDSRIFVYGSQKNWWSRAGEPTHMPAGEIGGPDTEIFYDFGANLQLHEHSPYADQPCHPNCDCGRFIEIGNSVFMQYQKNTDGSFSPLSQHNVDYGGGLERLIMAAENQPDIFQTSAFLPLVAVLEKASHQSYTKLNDATRKYWRVLIDHTRSAIMLLSEGLIPSNKEQGYVLRRLLRKSMVAAERLTLSSDVLADLISPITDLYHQQYPQLTASVDFIRTEISKESTKFARTLQKGLREIAKLQEIDGEKAFLLYESYGFPLEITRDIVAERGLTLNEADFYAAQKRHRTQSQKGSTAHFAIKQK